MQKAHGEPLTLSNDLQQLTKARLTTFVLLTTAVGFGLSVDRTVPFDWVKLLHTILGTALVATCSSILNQALERHTDALMERTAARPFVTKRLPLVPTVLCGMALGILGVWELVSQVNALTAWVGVLTLALYVLVYTPLKPVTELNTLVGAIPGALPPLMGSTAAAGVFTGLGWSLFALLAVWQLPHFYAIAYMYREDYKRGKMRMISTQDESGKRTSWNALVWAVVLLPVSLAPLFFTQVGWLYPVVALVLDVAFIWCAVRFLQTPERSTARRLFFCSIIWLPLILITLVMATF